ncbi:MAG TPA: hypothetical protein VFK85_03930 [Anaeromyxobacteraceae bacterium]|nr:hypothetical protein [Anaeromyxobacteraceae bacterium]
MNLESVDLEQLAATIRNHVPPNDPPVGWLRGRSYFRDVIAHILHCSDLEAEDLVDTLEANGYLRFEGNPSERSVADSRWTLDPHGRR